MKKVLIFLCLGFTFHSLFAQEALADPLSQGEKLFEAMDYQGALGSFQKIYDDPSLMDYRPAAVFWLGKTYLILNDVKRADKNISYFLINYPGHALESEALYTKGRILLVLGDYEGSIGILNQFLAKYGENSFTPNSIFWIAEGTYQLGRWNEARLLYDRLLKIYPSSGKAEAAGHRVALIEWKLREEELLNLLKWSHQESMNAFDEFQRRERAFQKTLQEYETKLQELQSKDASAARIATLEAQVKALQSGVAVPVSPGFQVTNMDKLLDLKKQALDLKSFYLDWERSHGK